MTGMTMPQQIWYDVAAGFLGMWMAMMVAMMLPSLIPMLSRYRRSVRGADGIHLHGLTALVGMGYFVIWATLGAAAAAPCCAAVSPGKTGASYGGEGHLLGLGGSSTARATRTNVRLTSRASGNRPGPCPMPPGSPPGSSAPLLPPGAP